MPVIIPNTLANGVNADATKLNSNFAALKTAVDALQLAQLPTGTPLMWLTTAAPSGFLLCQGQAVSRSTYSALFAVLGTQHGAGDGATTFNLPNMRGRIPVGLDVADAEFDALGKIGGQKDLKLHTHGIDHDHPSATTTSSGTHHHTASQPAHSHTLVVRDNPSNFGTTTAPAAGNGGSLGSRSTDAVAPAITVDDDGLHTHGLDVPAFAGASGWAGSGVSNMNPFIVVNFIIKT